jgi:hypothetical protein
MFKKYAVWVCFIFVYSLSDKKLDFIVILYYIAIIRKRLTHGPAWFKTLIRPGNNGLSAVYSS